MVKKLPPRARHNFRKINSSQKKCSQKQVLNKLLERSKFTISGDTISLSNNQLKCVKINTCPKFEVPKPVKLGERPAEEIEYKDLTNQTLDRLVQAKACLSPSLKIKPLDIEWLKDENVEKQPAKPSSAPIEEDQSDDIPDLVQEMESDVVPEVTEPSQSYKNPNSTNVVPTASSIEKPKKKKGCKRKLQLAINNDNDDDEDTENFLNKANVLSTPTSTSGDQDSSNADKLVKQMKQKSILSFFKSPPSSATCK